MYDYKISSRPLKLFYIVTGFMFSMILLLVMVFSINLNSLIKETGTASYEITYISPSTEYANDTFAYLYAGSVDSRVKLYDESGNNAIDTAEEVQLYIDFNNSINKLSTLLFLFYSLALCVIVLLLIIVITSHRMYIHYLLLIFSYVIQLVFILTDKYNVFFGSFILIIGALIIARIERKRINSDNESISERYE